MESNNKILEADAKWAKDHHLELHPAITINDFTYRGDIEFADIREAICAAYQERPNHCNLDEIWEKEAGERPYIHGQSVETEDRRQKSHMKFAHVMGLLLGVCLVNFILWLYLQKKSRNNQSN